MGRPRLMTKISPKDMYDYDFMKIASVKYAFDWLIKHKYRTFNGLCIKGIDKDNCKFVKVSSRGRIFNKLIVYVSIECPECGKSYPVKFYKIKQEYRDKRTYDSFHVDCAINKKVNKKTLDNIKNGKYDSCREKTALLSTKHGESSNRFYNRFFMVNRNREYKNRVYYDVSDEWRLETPKNFYDYETGARNREKYKNFEKFVTEQVKKLGYNLDELKNKDFSVVRIDRTEELGPDNCYVKLRWLTRKESLKILQKV